VPRAGARGRERAAAQGCRARGACPFAAPGRDCCVPRRRPWLLRTACREPMDGKQAGLKQDRFFFATVGPWA